jgi:hypothetical protein
VRDHADVHEAYIDLFPGNQRGFGATAGRMMVNYGEGRLIGTPQWGNISRSYDLARVYWRSPKAQMEVLFVSPVKPRIAEFNRPVLGDRIIGTYNTFPDFYKKNLLEAYLLRRTQNRPAGFSAGSGKDGTDRLGITTVGFRLAGPAPHNVKFSLEGVLQGGRVGPAELSAGAWSGAISRPWTVAHRTLEITCDYKFASGTGNPANLIRSGTFDQLYAAHHDRFGHQDLFGWRNIHNARSVAAIGLSRNFALNLIYDNYWLSSSRDALYNGSGRAIARSATGNDGRHVGQEADVFGTYKYKHFTFGAGYGHFFPGQFIRKTTPGVGPTYLYVFHSYSL